MGASKRFSSQQESHNQEKWKSALHWSIVFPSGTKDNMIHDNLPNAIENLSARIIAIRDSL
jgi:hypothetical protein